MRYLLYTLLGLITLNSSVNSVASTKLISDQTIDQQKKLTKKLQLKNGIPVILRQSENSDIIHIDFNFRYGFKDQKQEAKSLSDLMFAAMTRGAKDWPKERIFQTLERYSARIGCDMGIENSSCQLTAVDDFLAEVLAPFAASIQNPIFNPEDIELLRRNQLTKLQSRRESPDFTANEMTNRIFYGNHHPYFLPIESQIKHLQSVSVEAIKKLHTELLQSHIDSIIVVSSLQEKDVLSQLESVFGELKPGNYQAAEVPLPGRGLKQNFIFEHQSIPTAYIRIKMPMPGVTDSDFEAANLMIKVLDEELSLEIRTKRSLSYAVFSYMINYSRGIGMIGVTTSKPKETLEAISYVIDHLKKQPLDDEELEKYKTVYATSYFLRMEDHASLASSLSRFYSYYRSVDPMYEAPKRLATLKAKDIHQLANKYLTNFKMGVVFERKNFKDEWAERFLKKH
ncbi:MAG: M16 family metallopeptidase [Oligoflexus sp.]